MESDQSFKLGVPASLLKTEIIRIILPLSLVCGVKLCRFIVMLLHAKLRGEGLVASFDKRAK